MSREMDMIRAAFDEERDLVALFADEARARTLLIQLLHPDAEFEFVRSAERDEVIGVTGTRLGVEGVLGAWAEWLEPYSSYHTEPRGMVPIEDGVLTVIHALGVTRTGAVALEEDQASVWRFRDGKVSRWEAWLHSGDAKAAYGL